MKVMCHVGPWSAAQYRAIATSMRERADITLASGHKLYDESGLASRYYDFLREYDPARRVITDSDIDMIKRCRLLRAIDFDEAKKHLDSMRSAISEAFDHIAPDLVLSETIDSFLMDLIYAESLKRNIPFIGLVPSFVNGYFRVTARGEYNNLRTPSPDEVSAVLSLLEEKNYHPAFLRDSKKSPYWSTTKRWARNLIKPPYFILKRALSGEKYNYHYWATQIVSTQWFHLFPKFKLGDPGWEARAKASRKPVIYVPLQMIPEATVDYWCENIEAVDYDNTLIRLIENLSDSFHFLIKEHPNVLGFRNPAVYQRLKALDEVTICPTNINSNRLVESCDAVLVWTGTAGFEAALRGKPVLAVCNAYYMSGRMFKVITPETAGAEIKTFIQEQSRPLSDAEKYQMVEYLLSGLSAGRYKIDGSWSLDNSQDVQDAEHMGKALAKVFPA